MSLDKLLQSHRRHYTTVFTGCTVLPATGKLTSTCKISGAPLCLNHYFISDSNITNIYLYENITDDHIYHTICPSACICLISLYVSHIMSCTNASTSSQNNVTALLTDTLHARAEAERQRNATRK